MTDRLTDRPFLLEMFVLFNLAFLILDVLVAHAVNAFAYWEEWIPVAFSGLSALCLIPGVLAGSAPHRGWSRTVGQWVGGGALLVGVGGLVLHLNSQFFVRSTLHDLVYAAPFAAPLAYAGLGFLLLLNRSVAHETIDWGRWVILLALGGFVGNFALSVADHAQNGFFYAAEWLGVIGAGAAIGFLIMAVVSPDARLIAVCYGVLALQVAVGLAGFVFHLRADWPADWLQFRDSFVFGAPIFAPLLFIDVSILAGIGLWDVREKLPIEVEPVRA